MRQIISCRWQPGVDPIHYTAQLKAQTFQALCPRSLDQTRKHHLEALGFWFLCEFRIPPSELSTPGCRHVFLFGTSKTCRTAESKVCSLCSCSGLKLVDVTPSDEPPSDVDRRAIAASSSILKEPCRNERLADNGLGHPTLGTWLDWPNSLKVLVC